MWICLSNNKYCLYSVYTEFTNVYLLRYASSPSSCTFHYCIGSCLYRSSITIIKNTLFNYLTVPIQPSSLNTWGTNYRKPSAETLGHCWVNGSFPVILLCKEIGMWAIPYTLMKSLSARWSCHTYYILVFIILSEKGQHISDLYRRFPTCS